MVTLRYKLGGDYSEPPTGALDTAIFSDLSHDFQVDFAAGDAFGALDKTTGQSVEFTDAETHERITDGFTGVYADLSGVTGQLTILGGRSGDILIAGSNDDNLDGGGGNDILEGGAGADTFNGRSGYDTVSYEHSSAAVAFSDIFGNFGDAQGDALTDIEAIRGTSFDDSFFLLNPYVVEGGAGADSYVGNLTVSYAHSGEGVSVDLSGATASFGGDAAGDTFSSITGVIGSHFADTLIATDTASTLKGYGGLDTITGGAGNDLIAVTGAWASIDGGDGFDRLFVRAGGGFSDGIVPDAGTLINVEKVIVASGTALDLSQQSAIDGSIKVNSRVDDFSTVIGTQFDDRIVGGAGSDFLAGLGGHDRLSGGQGADVFGYCGLGQQGVITDFSGHNGDQDKIFFFGGTAPAFVDAFSGDGSAEVRTETRAPGVQIVFFDYDGDGRSDVSIRVLATDALTADDLFVPPPFGGPDSGSSGTLATSHAFVEALVPHDIAGLI